MNTVAVLLRARLRMVLNTAFKQSREARGWTLIIAVVGLGAVVLFYRLANVVFAVSANTALAQTQVATGALALLGGFVAVTSITFALSSLYFARDLDTLLSTPIRPRDVILSRIYTQLALGLALGTLLGGPPILAFLVSHGQTAMLPLIGITVVAFAAIPMSLATAAIVIALRLVPGRYVRDSGGLVVTLAVFAITAINLAVRGTEAFTSVRLRALPFGGIGSGIAGSSWSPAEWAGRSVIYASQGDIGGALAWALPLMALALLLPPLVSWLVERAYLSGYQRNATASRGNTAKQRRVRPRSLKRKPIWLLLAGKDLRQIRRDPSQIGQLALPLVLFAFYLGRPGGNPIAADKLPVWFFVLLTSTFASLLFAANIGLRGIGIEGQKMWLLKVAPFDPRQLLASKYLSGFVVAALPALVLFSVGEVQGHPAWSDVILPLARFVVLMATVVALAVGMGALKPRLDWTDPRRAVGIGTTLLYLGTGSLYLTGAFIMFGLPYAFGGAGVLEIVLCDLTVVVVSAVIVGVMSWAATQRLQRLEL